MCLILIAWQSHPRYPLVVAANRDEFYERPTVGAHFWKDAPALLAGRDLRQGGTWLGLNRDGRFAAITNYRGGESANAGKRSRGELVANYLLSRQNAEAYLSALEPLKNQYNPFNLLVGDRHALAYSDDESEGWRQLPVGVHALGNHRLNSETAKEEEGCRALERVLRDGAEPDALLAVLADTAPTTDSDNPLERGLSSRFIRLPDTGYGTRASTAIRIDRDGNVDFVEQSFDEGGPAGEPIRHRFRLS